MRVIVTGSRKFCDTITVLRALLDIKTRPIIVVHGACATGADNIASFLIHRELRDMGFSQEKHPADWLRKCDENCYHRTRLDADSNNYCPMAGLIRNQEIVDLGADLCLAFLRHSAANRGTIDMIKRCKKAGIPVNEYWQV